MQFVSRSSLVLSTLCLFLLLPSKLSAERITCDKPLYDYAEEIPVELELKDLFSGAEYSIIAVDAYDRVWLSEKHSGPSGKKMTSLRIPRMKGLAISLIRHEAGQAPRQVSSCRLLINARGAGQSRPENFVNMIYGGATCNKKSLRAMRQMGLNGGMAYMWNTGAQFAVCDMDYYHEYASERKRDIQDTEFQDRRAWFINDVNFRGCTIREDVLGHGTWKKEAMKSFDPENKFPAEFAKYNQALQEMREGAELIRSSSEPWTLKNAPKFDMLSFIHIRPRLARLKPIYLFQRPYNFYNPDENIYTSFSMQKTASKDKDHQSLGYSIGDEISNTNFTNPFDYDFSEISLSLFRDWLKKEYPSLDALNKEWDCSFSDWSEVVPYTNDETRILNMPEYRDRMLKMITGDKKLFVIPWDKRTAPEKRNYASWADWRSFQDGAWAKALTDIAEATRKADPATPVGILGAQAPSPYGGFDYDKLFTSGMNWIEAYDISCSKEILRSFNKRLAPDKRWITTRTHFPGGDAGVYCVWYYVLMRDSNNVVWQLFNPKEGGFFEDEKSMKPTEKAVTLRESFLEVSDGIGKMLMESEEPLYPIAIYLSQSSSQAHWMIDSESDGATWIKRSGSWEGRNNSQNNDNLSWTKLLDDLGYQYDFVGKSSLLAGELFKKGYRLLVLPKTISLSDAEAEAIRKFAESGGVVIADTMTGTLDGHCKARPGFKGALDKFFGIRRTNYDISEGYKEDVWPEPCFVFAPSSDGELIFKDASSPLAKGYSPQKNFYVPESGISEDGSEAIAAQGDTPAFFMKKHGAGSSLYMSASILRYCEDRLEPDKVAAIRTAVGNAIREFAKLAPSSTAMENGKPCNLIKSRRYSFGENAWLLGFSFNAKLIQDDLGNVKIDGLENTAPRDVELRFDRKGHLYDLRRGKYLGEGSSCTVSVRPSEAELISVLPYKIEEISLSGIPAASADGAISVAAEAKIETGSGLASARHLVRFEFFSPSGVRARYATVFANAEKGVAKARIHLSPNDAAGTWELIAHDVHTGTRSQALRIEKKSSSFRGEKIPDDPFADKFELIDAIPEVEHMQKPGVFVALRPPTVSVSKDKFEIKVQIVHLRESETVPEGTISIYGDDDPSDKKILNFSEALANDGRMSEVVFSRPIAKARDMTIVAETEYEGVKKSESQKLKMGVCSFGTPEMDGDISDSVWAKSSVLSGFTNFDSGEPSKYPSKVRMLHDDKYLYVGLDMDAGGGDKLKEKEIPRDGDWFASGLNTMEILIGRTHAGDLKYNLAASCNGAQSDKLGGNGQKYDGIPWELLSRKSTNGWTAEARIPFAALGCGAPGNGDVWLMNFNSNAFPPEGGNEISQYSPQGREDFNLARFGKIIMSGNPKPALGKLERSKDIPDCIISTDAKISLDRNPDDPAWKSAPELKLVPIRDSRSRRKIPLLRNSRQTRIISFFWSLRRSAS